MTEPTLASLAARLALLEDERAILATMHRYGHSIDYGLHEDWLDCFTEDASYDLRYRAGTQRIRIGAGAVDGNHVRHVGQEKLRIFIAQHSHAPHKWHKHLLVEPSITVAGDTATAQSYFLRVDEIATHPTIVAMGRYRDSFRRCADGKWRFSERIAEVEARPDL